jgi:F-type H+-transporting ATPase subunit epsilon
MELSVSVLNPKEVVFEGKARSLIVPGEEGVFEILPFHKRVLSRLISGVLFIDERSIPIHRGIIKVDQNKVSVIIEERVVR